MPVIVRGDRAVEQRLDKFPQMARARLLAAIEDLTARLDAAVEAAAPYKTGKLRGEIRGRVYNDREDRVAGYVGVYAPGDSLEYPKAATLEYGTDKVRRRLEKRGVISRALFGKRKRIVLGTTKVVHIAARRYLRGPLAAMEPEIRAELDAALNQATTEANAL